MEPFFLFNIFEKLNILKRVGYKRAK